MHRAMQAHQGHLKPELAQISAQPVSVMKGIRGLAEAISE